MPSPNRQNNFRWDEIGGYVVSTIRLPEEIAAASGAAYETLVYSRVSGAWDIDDDGVQTDTEAEANVAHDAACVRLRGRIQ
jgi:hypothetical protein